MKVLQMMDVLGFGGAQKVVETFVREARTRDIDTSVVSLKDDSPRENSTIGGDKQAQTMTDQLEQAGARVVVFPGKRLLDPTRMRSLVDFFKREKFDVVQTHLTYANILGAYAGYFARIPVVSTLHSVSMERALYHPLRDGLETLALSYGAEQVVAVGYAVAQVHQRRIGKKKAQVVPNAVPSPVVLTEPERLLIRKELIGDAARPLVISVGRLVEPKGYPDLIDAFTQVRQIHPEAVLVIVGDGEMRGMLNDRIKQAGLTDNVRLLGSRADVPRLLAASDMFVLSSHWEGLPMAVLEAMMAGLPVVATAVGDIPRVVPQSAGLLTPPKNPQQLAQAISAYLADPIQRRIAGVAAREYAQTHFSSGAWFERLLEVFEAARSGVDPR